MTFLPYRYYFYSAIKRSSEKSASIVSHYAMYVIGLIHFIDKFLFYSNKKRIKYNVNNIVR